MEIRLDLEGLKIQQAYRFRYRGLVDSEKQRFRDDRLNWNLLTEAMTAMASNKEEKLLD